MDSTVEKQSLLIIGAGGHGKTVAELAILSGRFSRVAFLDDACSVGQNTLGLEVIGRVSSLKDVKTDFDYCFVAIGNNTIRRKLIREVESVNLPLAILIHPKASVSQFAEILPGTVILAGAVVGVDVKIGEGVIVNSNVTIDHDCVLKKFVHIGVGANLSGGVIVDEYSWVQAGASIGCSVYIEKSEIVPVGHSLKNNN